MNCCEVLTTTSLMDPCKFLEKPRYIFVDDAQFICAKHEDGRWFKSLYDSWKRKEGRDKMFWVFYGEHQYQGEKNQEFVFQDDIDEELELTTIIRNSKQIAKHACRYSDDEQFKKAVEERGLVHNFDGEEVDMYLARLDTKSDHEYAIGHCLKNLKRDGWNFGDIAVLFSKDKDIPPELLDYTRESFSNPVYNVPGVGKVKVGSASKNHDRDYLVVDTVRRYSSLDRPVVIGINPNVSKFDLYTNPDGLELILATRAIAKLIVIRKVSGSGFLIRKIPFK